MKEMIGFTPLHSPLSRRPLSRQPGRWTTLGVLVLVALATRGWQLGNPVVHVDDQFYRLVGERMLDGAVPYVTIWDRKPLGLFLLYAGIRALGGEGYWQYGLVAAAFAIATALVIARIASRFASPGAALAGGCAYLLYLPVFGGEGGQSPVFYNLLVALAGWATMTTVAPREGGRTAGLGSAAMLLVGIALQLKYTAVFEGGYFGLALLWSLRARGAGPVRLAAAGVRWILLALAPTALAWLWYWRIGAVAAFDFANFSSILLRGSAPPLDTAGRLAGMALKLLPLAALAAAGLRRGCRVRRDEVRIAERAFLAGWAAAAIAGVLIFGSYFDHYALPMLVPLSIAAAPALVDRALGLALVARGRRIMVPAGVVMAVFAITVSVTTVGGHRKYRGTGGVQREMAALIRPRLHGRCLFVFDGDAVLYQMAGSCLPSRWAFPDHLTNARETGAIGVDQLGELRRIMAGRPPVVVSGLFRSTVMNRASWNYMAGELARDYRPLRTWQVQHAATVFVRKDAG